MSKELLLLLNTLIKAVEVAQSRGAYKLQEAKVLSEAITNLQELFNPKKEELSIIDEEEEEQINI
tara:strand:- start:243 stop:437 length:195 start_codon:yes stop_codon:yes gene_type:complete